MDTEDDPLIGYGLIAELVGVKPGTVRKYRTEGRFPPPDNLDVPDRPRWYRSTVVAWMENRPGQGARTDRRKSED